MKKIMEDFEDYVEELKKELKTEDCMFVCKKVKIESQPVEVETEKGTEQAKNTVAYIYLSAFKPKSEKEYSEKLIIYLEKLFEGLVSEAEEAEATKKLEIMLATREKEMIKEIQKTPIRIQKGEVVL